MKRMLSVLVLVSLLAGMSLAMELAGKTGIGLRASSFSVRRFVNNSFAWDLSGDYFNSTQSGQADSNYFNYAVSGFWVKEIYPGTLLQIGAALQNWQGSDAGANYNGLSINPFFGAECFINDHFSLDWKILVGYYGSQMKGATRTTELSVLGGNLGAHLYF